MSALSSNEVSRQLHISRDYQYTLDVTDQFHVITIVIDSHSIPMASLELPQPATLQEEETVEMDAITPSLDSPFSQDFQVVGCTATSTTL